MLDTTLMIWSGEVRGVRTKRRKEEEGGGGVDSHLDLRECENHYRMHSGQSQKVHYES